MVELAGEQASRHRKQEQKLTGPRFDRAILRQAKRVPNDKGSSLSTVGELNPRESKAGNSSRSIPCRKVEIINFVTSKLNKYSLSMLISLYFIIQESAPKLLPDQ